MDSVSTQRFTAVGIKELNPIAKHFVGTRGKQAFISAVGIWNRNWQLLSRASAWMAPNRKMDSL